MKKLPDRLILDLPDAPDFISKPPVYTHAEMIAICEKMLPYWNEQRRKNPPKMVVEPFELYDEEEKKPIRR